MKSFLSFLLLPLLFLQANAFTVQTRTSALAPKATNKLPSTFLQAKKLSAEEQAKADMYWAGDWVCKDCGYVYDRVSLCLVLL